MTPPIQREPVGSPSFSDEIVSRRVFTTPNIISFARLLLVPVFVGLFVTGRDWPALIVLFVLGNTDWVDGYVARRTGQVSELGKILDPISDRIAIVAVMLSLLFRNLVPLGVAGVILLREALVAVAFGVLEARGAPRIPVNRVGKAATLAIFLGMGGLVIGVVIPGSVGENVNMISIGLLVFGAVLYWVATALYFVELRKQLMARRTA